MLYRDISCTKPYLHIPIRNDVPKNRLQIWLGDVLVREFYLGITDREDCFYCFLSIDQFSGKDLRLILSEPNQVTDGALARVALGAAPEQEPALYPDLYREALRPQFHFSSRRGWLNDPNGLLYADGKFHLYYQHNPMGNPHGSVNICWGHATSQDLVEWTERNDAILPWRRDWSIASGSALQDYDNVAGYGKDAIIAAFTVLGTINERVGRGYPSGGQFMAASMDGGDTFYRFANDATVPTVNGEGWRDPRIFRYGDHFVMAVYETDETGNCVTMYTSADLHHWEKASVNSDLYECPDLFPLEVNGQERWVLYGADGMARLGTFDGKAFAETGEKNPLDYGYATYAGQTWNHHPQGKRVHISWVRGMGGVGEDLGYEDMPFSQCMTIPTEITLRDSADGIVVCRRPIDELASLRTAEKTGLDAAIGGSLNLNAAPQMEYELTLTDLEEALTLRVGNNTIVFDPSSRTLTFDNGHRRTLDEAVLSLRVFVDTTTMELFFSEGVAATYAMAPQDITLALEGNGALRGTAWKLRSIWSGKAGTRQ